MCDTGHMAVTEPESKQIPHSTKQFGSIPSFSDSLAKCRTSVAPVRLFIGRSNWECVELETTEIGPLLCLTVCLSVCLKVIVSTYCAPPTVAGHKKARLIIKSRRVAWCPASSFSPAPAPAPSAAEANEHKWAQIASPLAPFPITHSSPRGLRLGRANHKKKYNENYEFVWRNFTRREERRGKTKPDKKKITEIGIGKPSERCCQ